MKDSQLGLMLFIVLVAVTLGLVLFIKPAIQSGIVIDKWFTESHMTMEPHYHDLEEPPVYLPHWHPPKYELKIRGKLDENKEAPTNWVEVKKHVFEQAKIGDFYDAHLEKVNGND